MFTHAADRRGVLLVATRNGPWLHVFVAVRAWMSWSSGKDSTFALQSLEPDVTVTRLLVTVNAEADRIAMHAVRRPLLESQAQRLGLPLHVVAIPSPCPNDVYEDRMDEALRAASREEIRAVVFGDLFLEDVRQYRERAMRATGMQPPSPSGPARPANWPTKWSPMGSGPS